VFVITKNIMDKRSHPAVTALTALAIQQFPNIEQGFPL
jgi:hypothetical protein